MGIYLGWPQHAVHSRRMRPEPLTFSIFLGWLDPLAADSQPIERCPATIPVPHPDHTSESEEAQNIFPRWLGPLHAGSLALEYEFDARSLARNAPCTSGAYGAARSCEGGFVYFMNQKTVVHGFEAPPSCCGGGRPWEDTTSPGHWWSSMVHEERTHVRAKVVDQGSCFCINVNWCIRA